MAHDGRPTVLLVEDEPAQREVLGYNLDAEGFRVVASDNGEDASSSSTKRRPTSSSSTG